jgi:tetratricopeptide (TPR) repeat protein
MLHGETYCLYFLGERDFRTRNYASAHTHYARVLELELKKGDRRTVGKAQLKLGETQRMLGDYEQASDLLTHARTSLGQIGALEEFETLARLSRLALYLGDFSAAFQHLADLDERAGPAYTPELKTFALQTRALLALQQGAPQAALAFADEAHQLGQASSNPYDKLTTFLILGHAAAAAEHRLEARAAYEQVLRLCEMLKIPTLAAEAHAGLANVASCEGDEATGLAHAEALAGILTETPRVGLDEPFLSYLACCRVLCAQHHPRAVEILSQGLALLLEYADHTADAAFRQSFLTNVAEHRELHQLYAQSAESRQQ